MTSLECSNFFYHCTLQMVMRRDFEQGHWFVSVCVCVYLSVHIFLFVPAHSTRITGVSFIFDENSFIKIVYLHNVD